MYLNPCSVCGVFLQSWGQGLGESAPGGTCKHWEQATGKVEEQFLDFFFSPKRKTCPELYFMQNTYSMLFAPHPLKAHSRNKFYKEYTETMQYKPQSWQFHWSFIASVGNERDCKKLHFELTEICK